MREKATPLANELTRFIKASGPIPLHNFHKLCLQHPDHGFYSRYSHGDIIGERGDFITSPEISQCFGEVLAANLIHKWIQFGQKRPITLIELGPGRGTLMSDVLRTFRGFNWISEKLKRVIMVESSDSLMVRQKQTVTFPVTSWVRDFAALNAEDFKDDCTFIIANEFLDCLPVYAFKRTQGGLLEYLVDNNENEADSLNHFKLCLSSKETRNSDMYGKLFKLQEGPLDSDVEVSPEALMVLRKASDIVSMGLGSSIFIDYGRLNEINRLTLRGYKNHKMVSMFENPGETDLTYDVNFSLLHRVLSSEQYQSKINFHHCSQRDFLIANGISARASSLIRNSPNSRSEIEGSVSKLVNEMGTLFQVFIVESTEFK